MSSTAKRAYALRAHTDKMQTKLKVTTDPWEYLGQQVTKHYLEN